MSGHRGRRPVFFRVDDVGLPPAAPPPPRTKRDRKRQLLEDARRETGNPRLTWKGAKKYWRKLGRIARVASTVNLQDG